LPLGPGNGETTLVATVNDQVSGWWSSTSLKHEGWGECGENPALSAVAMKIIVALSLANTGSSTGHWWVMAAIWPPLQQLTTCQSDRHYSNSQPINLTAITATHNLSIWPPLQQLTTYQSDRHYSNSQPIKMTAITATHNLSIWPPLQQLTTYQSDRHYNNSQPINLTAITTTHNLSIWPPLQQLTAYQGSRVIKAYHIVIGNYVANPNV